MSSYEKKLAKAIEAASGKLSPLWLEPKDVLNRISNSSVTICRPGRIYEIYGVGRLNIVLYNFRELPKALEKEGVVHRRAPFWDSIADRYAHNRHQLLVPVEGGTVLIQWLAARPDP